MIKTPCILFCLHLFIMQLAAQSYIENHLYYSDFLSEERIISVSLPVEYTENDKDYPVLYVLDGEYIFDYARGTMDFLTNEFGYLPEMIVVGIPNTSRSRDLFVTPNPEDSYANFVKFLKDEVFQFITQNYRINEFKILYGWSSGSGICTYLLATEPDLIQGHILTGSGIGRGFASFVEAQISNYDFQNHTFLYVNTEKGQREPSLHRYKALIDTLNLEKLDCRFEVVEQSHVNIMQTGLDAGLKFMFSDFSIPNEICLEGFDAILNYYKDLAKKYNFEFNIPLGAINESAGLLFSHEKKEEAIKLLEYGIALYPHSPALCGSIAEIYSSGSQNQLAKNYFKMAMERSSSNIQDFLKYKTLLSEISH